MVGIDIFSGKKCEDICPSTHNMQVPNVTRKELEVFIFVSARLIYPVYLVERYKLNLSFLFFFFTAIFYI